MYKSSSLFAALLLISTASVQALETEQGEIDFDVVTDGLDHPWSFAFLPDGRVLVTERPGALRMISADGDLLEERVGGLPRIKQHGQGGLLDVVLHPDFASNRWVYISYAEAGRGGYGTAVGRGRLKGMALQDFEVLFRLSPKTGTPFHFGSRLVFDREG